MNSQTYVFEVLKSVATLFPHEVGSQVSRRISEAIAEHPDLEEFTVTLVFKEHLSSETS